VIDLLQRANRGLPAVRAWVEAQLAAHASGAVPIAGLGFERLPRCFSAALLSETRSVTVARIPIPPFSAFGLPELASIETMGVSGVTFKNVCFVHASVRSESIHCHELVHAVQWRALGVDQFMLTYAMGLLQHGYAHSPLEAMAYDLQSQFDRGRVLADAEALIRDQALALRDLTADLFRQHGLVMGQS
jgi:hypothetical protein